MFRSKHEAETQSAEVLFATHKQLAQRFKWHQKLFMASRVALVVAVVGLLIYILFAYRLFLQLSPLAFLLALFIPHRSGQERALEHIDADIGLSYRTALEYQDNKSEFEQVDFSSLLLKRAAYRVRNLELPDLQPWWLPMLVTSIVLSLIPFFLNATPLNFGGRGLLGNSNFQRPLNQPPPQEPLAEEQAETEDEQFDEQAAEDASDLDAQDQDDADLESSFEDSSQEPDRNVSEAEGETLSRFLDNLKEKPQPEENLTQQNRQNRQSSEDGTSESEAENSEQPESQRAEEASREEGESQEDSESGEEQGAGANEEGEQQANDESDDAQEQGEDAAANRDGENEGEEGGQEGARPDIGGRQQGDEETNFGSEDNENGIGTGASEPTPNSGERIEGQMQAPELLEGQIMSDETTIAGEVRLPGSDQVEIPEGLSPQEFDRAVERAIAEGRIPVEYQEILKNYFR